MNVSCYLADYCVPLVLEVFNSLLDVVANGAGGTRV